MKELDISATYINGEGAYTGEGKRIIMCAIKKYLYPKLKDYVHEIDPGAFTIVTSAKEIYGEGYKNHKDGDLMKNFLRLDCALLPCNARNIVFGLYADGNGIAQI